MHFVLSENEKILVNVENVASFCVQNVNNGCEELWKIIAMYPAVSTDVLCDVLAEFEKEDDCKSAFNSLLVSLSLGTKITSMKDCIEPFKL